MNITIQQMRTLDAIVREGSIQAAAHSLNKTHPSVITALKKLEDELGFALFDRSGYRSVLTEEGHVFHRSIQRLLHEMEELSTLGEHLKRGEETELNIVIGDVTPKPAALQVLKRFSDDNPHVQLNLLFENLQGPVERLHEGEADLIIHHIDKADPLYEYKDFCPVAIIPVAAPGFFKFALTDSLKYSDLQHCTQCTITDTAREESHKSNYFHLPTAPKIKTGDQHTKREILLQGMAWGHMPDFLIKEDLEKGSLLSLTGKNLKGTLIDIVVARSSQKQRGVIAERLWDCF